jgi:hypothetical protein
VNLLRDNVDSVKKSTETVIDASNQAYLEIKIEKTKYVYVAVSSQRCRSKPTNKNEGREKWV